jgi:uncharacterized OsmC-like protein
MSGENIRSAIEAATVYLSEHPDEARYTDSAATATLTGGLGVRVEGPGGVELTTDMPPSVGGDDTGPSPGWVFRAALASCEATLIAMRAAAEGIELDALAVEVDSESDDRGILGIDDRIPAGPFRVRVRVRIDAPGTGEVALQRLVDWAWRHCPVDDAVRRAVPIEVLVDR